MDNLGPISASAPGTSVDTATGVDLTFNTRYPFHKLDSTNPVSFQVINILFNDEPPNPNGTSVFYQRNLVYQFPHGYTYVPSSWFLVSINEFQSAYGSEGAYLVGGGDTPTTSAAVFIATLDVTNVNFYIDKYWVAADAAAPTVLGMTLSVRSYIFVNDLLGFDVPIQA